MKNVTDKGMYAPMTRSGNYFIVLENNEKILAHSFANIRNPELLEPLFKLVISVWEGLFGEPEASSEIHPAAEWMMETLSAFVHK